MNTSAQEELHEEAPGGHRCACEQLAARRHSTIAAAALIFCAALIIFRLLGRLFAPYGVFSQVSRSEVLYTLQTLVTVSTALYLVLRRSEGDFRALFIVSLGLFIGNESLTALASRFGLITLEGFGSIFNISLFMFSSLALTAAIADGPQNNFYRRALLTATTGFLFLAALRTFLDLRQHHGLMPTNYDRVMIIILSILSLSVGILIALQEVWKCKE
jgi:hypothetical protein